MKQSLLRWLFLLAGLTLGGGLFVYMIEREGAQTVATNVMSFGILPILGFVAISLLNFCLYSKRWQWIVNDHLPKSEHVSFGRIYLHRMAGYALGYLTPGTQVAGEPIRVALHVRDGVPHKEATSAAVLDIAIESVAYVTFLSAGVVLAAVEGIGGGSLTTIVLILGLVFIFLAAFFALVASGRGFFQHLFRWTGLFRIKRLKHLEQELIKTEMLMGDFLSEKPWRMVRLALISTAAISFRIVEVFYLAWFFGVNLSFGQAFLVSTLPGVALLLPVPGGLGVFESGFAAVFLMLDIPLDPVSFALIIRLRDAVFIAFGLGHVIVQGGKVVEDKIL